MNLLYILHKQHNELPVSAHCHSYFTCQNALKVPIYLYAVYVSTTLFLLVNNAIKSWSWWCLVQAKYLCVCLESGSGVGVFLTLSLPFLLQQKIDVRIILCVVHLTAAGFMKGSNDNIMIIIHYHLWATVNVGFSHHEQKILVCKISLFIELASQRAGRIEN